MAQGKWVVDVDARGFQEQVVARSRRIPVLVDFWAPWCAPCRTLGPVLEKLAGQMEGKFLLAKVNSDENPDLGRKYGVRGIPAVKLFVDGRVVDEFTGALPESSVRAFLEKALPSHADRLATQAGECETRGDLIQAGELYGRALEEDSAHPQSLLGLSRILLESGQLEDAVRFLERLPPSWLEKPEAKKIKARLAFQGADAALPPLQAAVARDPGDLGQRLALGRALVAGERYEEALEQFLEVVRRDRAFQEDAGRKAVLEVFDLLGAAHPLVSTYRARLSRLLFS
ncbi:MAG: tetratricopeptide repeat protein [Magnetococcales bacterium]|nr:tetratricopeptide repeat protein [Magnetococcales bacterium]